MADKNESVWARLTRLFKSGPIVRHKIASSSKMYEPEGTARAYKKELSSLYVNSLASYGQYERLARYADFCLTGDTNVAVSEKCGTLTIKEIVERFEHNENTCVFSCDPSSGKVVASKVLNAWCTGEREIWEVELDSGQVVSCTDNHPFMLRDGNFCRADMLSEGTALMPFRRKDFNGYRWILKKGFATIPEHVLVAEYMRGNSVNGSTEHVHHKNFIREDNSFSNLEIMDAKEHLAYHARINNRRFDIQENRDAMSVVMKARWSEGGDLYEKKAAGTLLTEKGRETHRKNRVEFNKTFKPGRFNKGRQDQKGMDNANADRSFTFQDICNVWTPGMGILKLCDRVGKSAFKIRSRIKDAGFKSFEDFSQNYENHKVVSVKKTSRVEPVYDITVDRYSNFALSDGESQSNSIFVHNSEMDYTPEISSALDIYADETTAVDERGYMIQIESSNSEIKEMLDTLFFDILNIEFNLHSYVRNLPIRRTTKIPLLDGRNVTIEELANEFELGKENWVYSIQDGTKRIVPGRITWCGLTRKAEQLIRTWLDDGTYVDTTLDHEFIMRDGSRKRADELAENDSLMPFYRKVSSHKDNDQLSGYEKVYDPATNRHVYTHRRVAEMLPSEPLTENDRHYVTHHIDFDKRNNDPKNLRRLGDLSHLYLHHVMAEKILKRPDVTEKRMLGIDRWLRSDEHKELAREQIKVRNESGEMGWHHYNNSEEKKFHDKTVRSSTLKNNWKDENFRRKSVEASATRLDSDCLDYVQNAAKKIDGRISLKKLTDVLKDDDTFIDLLKCANTKKKRGDVQSCLNSPQNFGSLVSREAGKHYSDFLFEGKTYHDQQNHKVVRTEILTETDDVYCMNVIGSEGEHDRHNFMILGENGGVNSGVCVANCKYGDFVLFVDASETNGILNLLPIPINEIEREEGYDPKNPFAFRFRWLTQGNMILEAWQIIHFRLLGNDNFLPYGSSVIEPARRIWRQLILIEDAMLVYRIVRSPERRVFEIEVGNVKAEDMQTEMEKIISRLKRSTIVDSTTGRVDLRYNPLSVDEDYFLPMRDGKGSKINTLPGGQFPVRRDTLIPLLDGRILEIEELAAEYNEGKENWVHSIDDVTGAPLPGKVIWCGKNYDCSSINRIWLNDGSYIDVAPEHPIVMRDGSHKRADCLNPGDSVMPFSSRESVKEDGLIGYRVVKDNSDDEMKFLHRIVACDIGGKEEALLRANEKSAVVHHEDFKKIDNSPRNLKWMGFWEHRKLHVDNAEMNLRSPEALAKLRASLGSDKHREFIKARAADPNDKLHTWIHGDENKNRLRSYNEDPEFSERTSIRNSERWDDPTFRENHSGENHWNFLKWKKVYDEYTIEDLKEFCVSNNITAFKDLLSHPRKFLDSKAQFRKFLLHNGVKNWTSFARDYLDVAPGNHTVDRVEVLDVTDAVYCMTVVGQNGEENRHNFAVLGRGVDRDVCVLDGIYVKNTGDIEDVQYIQSKLFAALKIPKAYLGYEAELGCLRKDTRIPTLDGTESTVEELEARMKSGEQLFVYSYADGSLKVGRVNRVWVTKRVNKLFEVTLDDGSVIHTTGNHPFMIEDETYINAGDLVVGQNLMPDRSVAAIRKITLEEYEPVYDIEVEEWSNFLTSAGVVVHNSKSTLSQEDVRFSRTIQRIQKIVLSELTKIAVIHLYILGYRDDDLIDYEIKMANPSTIAEQQKLELWRMKLEIAGTAQEGVLDKKTVWQDIFGFSDEKIETIEDGMRFDKRFQLEIENMQAEDLGAGPDEPAPGEEELPKQLGGGEEMPPTNVEDDLEAPGSPSIGSLLLTDNEDIDEVRNPGSEGDRGEIAVDKGRNMFSTGEDQFELVFGTEKQAASDPFDMAAQKRMVARPFSESADNESDPMTEYMSKCMKEFESAVDVTAVNESYRRTRRRRKD